MVSAAFLGVVSLVEPFDKILIAFNSNVDCEHSHFLQDGNIFNF